MTGMRPCLTINNTDQWFHFFIAVQRFPTPCLSGEKEEEEKEEKKEKKEEKEVEKLEEKREEEERRRRGGGEDLLSWLAE